MEATWLDISVPCGEAALAELPEGAAERARWLGQAAWLGTYVTAPPDVEPEADGEEPGAMVGRARVLHLDDVDCIRADSLARYEPRAGERLLLRTRNSPREWWKRPHGEDFVWLSEAAVRLLVECRVACVGVDYVARAGFHSEVLEVHQRLREAGVWLIEGLDLRGVPAGVHELRCLPLKERAEWGLPARALVRALSEQAA